MTRIILASASPRRKELMKLVCDDFEVIPADVDETYPADTRPSSVPIYLAWKKAMHIARSVTPKKDTFILGCDTVVLDGAEYAEETDPKLLENYRSTDGLPLMDLMGGEIMGKPADRADAERMLSRLSGKTHHVVTGCFGIYVMGEKHFVTLQFSEVTEVEFYPLTKKEIYDYIETGEPMDKAGAYGIQGKGSMFVSRINGSYDNVVGLPAARLRREMNNLLSKYNS